MCWVYTMYDDPEAVLFNGEKMYNVHCYLIIIRETFLTLSIVIAVKGCFPEISVGGAE